MSELEDKFKEMIRGLPLDDQYRSEHLKKVRELAMSEFDKAGRTTDVGSSRLRFAQRHAIGWAVAAVLLAFVSLGVAAAFLGRARQAELQSTMARADLPQVELELIASLQALEDSGQDQSPDVRDRAVEACLNWHFSRVAEFSRQAP